MMKTNWIVLTIAVALCTLTTAHAATISLEGFPAPGVILEAGDTGQLQVIVDNSPESFDFVNGGLSLSAESSEPGVIEFTGAEVLAPEFFGGFVKRWTSVSVTGLQADTIGDLFALSLATAGLDPTLPDNSAPDGSSRFVFATIDYQALGGGSTTVSVNISQRPDPLISRGGDVSDSVQFLPGGEINVVPEPAALMLAACLGLVGLAAGRRNRR